MQNYNCQNCGAELYWDVQASCLKCRFCDSEYQVSDFEDGTIAEEPVKSEDAEQEFVNTEVSEEMVVYECKNCGGEVVALKTTMATICPYCSEAISITSKSVGEFRPEICIPFQKDKKAAMELYKNYVSQSFLTPKAFKEQSVIEKIQGLFVPFHLHTIKDKASHTFHGERHTSRRVGYDRITTHRIYNLNVCASGEFERVPTDAAAGIQNDLMDALEPFDYTGLKDYNPAYMAGFLAEQRDDDPAKMDERAEERVKEGMEARARGAFSGYLGMNLVDKNDIIENHKSEYAMIPVWLLNVNHEGIKYTFAINGQSGKVVGKLPVDKKKLALIGAGVFIATDLIVALIAMLF